MKPAVVLLLAITVAALAFLGVGVWQLLAGETVFGGVFVVMALVDLLVVVPMIARQQRRAGNL